MSLVPESHRDILQSTALAHAATIGPKGEPQSSAVLFGWDGMYLILSMKKMRQKYKNLRREPRVALSLTDPTNPYRALEIRGSVERIEDDPNFEYINQLSRKYLQRDATPEERGSAEERAVIFIKPERVIAFP